MFIHNTRLQYLTIVHILYKGLGKQQASIILTRDVQDYNAKKTKLKV